MSQYDDEDLVTAKVACEILGGSGSPLHPSTLYRGAAKGTYPRPVKMGAGTSRWLVRELRQCRETALQQREAANV